uniref:Ribosome-releasing factor 2, mitochondrial n=1 Tax=Lygus hesperus TaxID=30085 RepID=A0A0K8S7X3_LYGHE
MDRSDADVGMCLNSLRSRLHCEPLSVQIPVTGTSGTFVGVVDLPSMDCITWDASGTSKNFVRTRIKEGHPLYEQTVDSRNELIDQLSSLDDELANAILDKGSLESMSELDVVSCIRRVTISEKAVPVVCGSSYKDVGVQPLLDAVVDFLPSPYQTRLQPKAFGKGDQLFKSFKVMHDKQRGPITFMRIYSGEISKGQRIYNASKDKTEQIGKILVPFADDFEEIPSASIGQYVAVTGLKYTHPGELLCSSAAGLKRIRTNMKTNLGVTDEEINSMLMLKSRALHPVFFCSVEVSSQAYQQALEKALAEMQREDSSLGVTNDAETGQTVLSGMGELHLDIVKDRLKSNYKLDVDVGKVQIMYKEKIVGNSSSSYHLVNSIGSQKHEVLIKLTLSPVKKDTEKILVLDNSSESAANLAHVGPRQLGAIERGIRAALSRGPIMGYQVIESQATLHWLESKRNVPEQLLSAAASHCIGQILKEGKTILLEPSCRWTSQFQRKDSTACWQTWVDGGLSSSTWKPKEKIEQSRVKFQQQNWLDTQAYSERLRPGQLLYS